MRSPLSAIATTTVLTAFFWTVACAVPPCVNDAAARKARKTTEAEAPKGALVPLIVTCATPGATVLVDGEQLGLTPMDLPVPVPPGDHTIKVTKLGYAPYIDVFSTKGKKDVTLELELVPILGVLHVKSSVPGARVLVDGRYVGDAPLDVEMDAGPRAVQVSKGGYKDFFQNVMAVAGQDLPLDVHLEELPPEINPYHVVPPPPPRWCQKKWVWGVIGVGALVVAGGAVVGGVLGSRPTDPTAGCQVCFNDRNFTPPTALGLSSW